jgi:hypothetical protein
MPLERYNAVFCFKTNSYFQLAIQCIRKVAVHLGYSA